MGRRHSTRVKGASRFRPHIIKQATRPLTQKDVAKKLKISQDGVSRLEQRSDVMLSTLRKYVEAMGGSLNLVAQFPDRPPVEIAGFSDATQPK